MAYVGQGIKGGTFSVLDTSGNTYNGSNVTFDLGTQVGSPAQLLVSHDGVIQKPVTDYTIATGGTQITFTTAPASGASIFITEISGAVGAPMNRDINGDELILDADADTSITADTDDQIDIRIAGNDDFKLTAKTLSIGGAAAADTAIVFDGNAQDFYIALDDSADDLLIGLGSTVGTTPAISIDENLAIKTYGDITMTGTTPKLTIGDAGAEDTMIVFDGNAVDYRLGLDDSADNFEIGIGSVHTTTPQMTFNSTGIILNEESEDYDFRVESNGNSAMLYVDGGSDFVGVGKNNGTASNIGNYFSPTSENHITTGNYLCLILNRQTDDGTIVSLKQGNSQEGTIAVSGSTVSYNTFCGAHWSRLADNSKPTILRGTVMESIATMCDWYQAVATDSDGSKIIEDIALPNGKSVGDAVTFTSKGKEYTGKYVKEDNEQLPMCKISDTADSKSVYGVFLAWDDADDGLDGDVNDMRVASLGAFVVRIHKDQTVAIGDYLVSNGDGTAKKQADDILRSNTIAKVTSTTKTHTHGDGSYCVPCTLHCG